MFQDKISLAQYVDEITFGDCLDLFKAIPAKSSQVSFADPPFNLDKKYEGGIIDRKKHEEYIEWSKLWLGEMVRVTKDDGSIFVHHIPKYLIEYAAHLNPKAVFKNWIAWDAPAGPMGKGLQPRHYGILYYGVTEKPKFYQLRHAHKYCIRCKRIAKDWGGKKDRIPLFGSLTGDCWTDIHRIKHGQHEKLHHPCILPVHLMERLILMSSDEGDIILDPFMGTGTTALAAKHLGRKYIGFELSQPYQKTAEGQLKQDNFSGKVGNSWVGFFRGEPLTIREQDWPDLEQYFSIPKDRKDLDRGRLMLKPEFRPKKIGKTWVRGEKIGEDSPGGAPL